MRRYEARDMRLVGKFVDGQFRIQLGKDGEQSDGEMLELGSGPSLVEALDDALQNAIIVEEDWRKAMDG